MDIPIKAVLEGIASMIERSVLPELATKYAKGQARAAVILLQDLIVQLEVREAALAEELDSLTTTLQGILDGLEETDELAADPALRELGDRIRSASMGGRPDDLGNLQNNSEALYALLDSCLPALAGAEKRFHGPSRELLGQIRRAIRAQLRRQFEIRARSAPPLEMDQLSK